MPPVQTTYQVATPPVSARTLAFLSLARHIAAFLSILIGAVLSLLHDRLQRSLALVGLRRRAARECKTRVGQGGRGRAVVVVGASEAAGESLTLHFAKSGYTVFPFLPLPSVASPPTSTALSSLLLAWSGTQKRLRARDAAHAGDVVPVMTDPEGEAPSPPINTLQQPLKADKGSPVSSGSRFSHAGETVRAYCRENKLDLMAVICASRSPKVREMPGKQVLPSASASPDATGQSPRTSPRGTMTVSPKRRSPDLTLINEGFAEKKTTKPPKTLPSPAMTMIDEDMLVSAYRKNIVDPLYIIDELVDLLATSQPVASRSEGSRRRASFTRTQSSKGKQFTVVDEKDTHARSASGRVVFVGDGRRSRLTDVLDVSDRVDKPASDRELERVNDVVQAARAATARSLRAELRPAGIDVCEVAVGPMIASSRVSQSRLGQSLEDDLQSREGEQSGIPAAGIVDLQDEKAALNSEQAELHSSGKNQQVVSGDPIPIFPGSASRNAPLCHRHVNRLYADLVTLWQSLLSYLHLLPQIWAVDDALLFSSVRRAVEDAYPREKHYAGVSPFVDDLVDLIPGSWVGRLVLGWVVRRIVAVVAGAEQPE